MILSILNDWWVSLSTPLQIFWGIALVSSVLFVIQFVLSLIGLDSDTDVDVSGDIDGDFSLDADFTVFSLRSIIAFFTFFGWMGVISLNGGTSLINSLIFSTLSGLAAMFLVAYMMWTFSKLGESGNLLLENAIYNTGEVYLPIPAESEKGVGKISIMVDGALRELEAKSSGLALPTGTPIKVIDITRENVLIVEPVNNLLDEN